MHSYCQHRRQLLELGVSDADANRALSAVGGRGLQAAIDFLFNSGVCLTNSLASSAMGAQILHDVKCLDQSCPTFKSFSTFPGLLTYLNPLRTVEAEVVGQKRSQNQRSNPPRNPSKLYRPNHLQPLKSQRSRRLPLPRARIHPKNRPQVAKLRRASHCKFFV